jgi:integrase/recombinase XerD
MLEHFFTYPAWRDRVCAGPNGSLMEGLAVDFHRRGYTRSGARKMLGYLGRLSRFAEGQGVNEMAQIDEVLVERFLRTVHGKYVRREIRGLAGRLRQYVPGHEFPRYSVSESQFGASDLELLEGYDTHLADVRGLSAATRAGHRRGAECWLKWLNERGGIAAAGKIRPAQVLDFATELLGQHSSGAWKGSVCGRARSFLRYLRWADLTTVDLAGAIPRVYHPRLASVPRHLPWDQVQKLIASVDDSDPSGMRDKALLLIISSLGLRSRELCELHLADIDWRAGCLRLRRTKTRRERVLPLPGQVGRSLSRYLLHGRPKIQSPHVFLRLKAPQGALESGAIMRIVAKHLARANIVAPNQGAHMLRHSLATRLVNSRVPMKTIADVLGHVDLDTTAAYTKVDIANLSAVALPFALGAEP